MGESLKSMVDASEGTRRSVNGPLVTRYAPEPEKQKVFSGTTFYKLFTDSELRRECFIAIRVKVNEFFYRLPKII